MTGPRVLSLIGAIWLSLGLLVAFWCLGLWNSSTPVGREGVRGASTDSQSLVAATPRLSPYVSIAAGDGNQLPEAKEYALYNMESGRVVLASPTMPQVPIASTTKLMTTYLVTKYGNLSDIVTVSQTGGTQQPSVMGLVPGERISVENLLYGALLVSGNDAAYTLGEYLGGKLLNQPGADSKTKVARAVQEMNKEAAALSMTNTHYLDPAGLDDDGHSTAVDLAKLTSLVDQQPELKKIIATPDLTVSDETNSYSHPLHNSNRLLADMPYPGALGGKTGYTEGAGHCLITSVRQNGITLIAVVLGVNGDTNSSAVASKQLLDIGFANLRVE